MRRRSRGFTILELAISLALVVALLSILLPALSSARASSAREECAAHLRACGQAWQIFLEDNRGQFPYLPVQPGWHYGGVRFSAVDDHPFLDSQRPLNAYLPDGPVAGADLLHCPADIGITGETSGVGTGRRSAYRSFGTSYRANATLLDDQRADAPRGLRREEITTTASRLVVMGDPFWYEIQTRTGRRADWHGEERMGNLLFLDGAVKFMTISPRASAPPCSSPG